MAKKTLKITSTQNWTVPNDCYIISELFLVGGGGGGAGGGASGGGGGGAGGRVTLVRDIFVTPGQQITLTIGGGGSGGAVGANGGNGQTTSFGSSYTAIGGGGGFANGGAGGSTSATIFGDTTNYAGNVGGGAAGAGAGGSGKNGGRGYAYETILYAGGGGGGISTFNANTPRPIVPGTGGPNGGGNGGGEDTTGTAGNDNPALAGTNGYGGGGGGGAASGTATEVTTPAVQKPNPTAPNRVSPATAGAAGGSGIIIISYDPAEFVMVPAVPGVREGETITINVKTAHVRNGASVEYTLSGTGVTEEDFQPNGLTGSFTVSSANGGDTGTGTLLITLANDAFTESSSESVTVSLNNGLAVTSFLVGDWSQNPLANIERKTISVSDYNDIRTKVARVLGMSTTTNADYGWGQLVQSTAVSESSKVSATDWNNLRFDIINSWIHLYNTTPSLVSAVANAKVRGNYQDSPYSQYDAYANVIEANRFGVSSSQSIVTTESTLETTWPGTYGTSWSVRAYSIITVSWTTAAEARHFFNSGGQIRFTSTRTGGSATNQNSAWSQILAASGTQAFGGALPQQGKAGTDGKNFYRLTNSYQTWYEITASNPYSANRYRITARSPGVSSNNTGTATSVQFQIEWIDDHAAQGGTTPDAVDGTLSLVVAVQRAIGTLQPSGSGNFSISAPTITVNSEPRS